MYISYTIYNPSRSYRDSRRPARPGQNTHMGVSVAGYTVMYITGVYVRDSRFTVMYITVVHVYGPKYTGVYRTVVYVLVLYFVFGQLKL